LEQFGANHVEQDPCGLVLLIAIRVRRADLFDLRGTARGKCTLNGRQNKRFSGRGDTLIGKRYEVIIAGFAN